MSLSRKHCKLYISFQHEPHRIYNVSGKQTLHRTPIPIGSQPVWRDKTCSASHIFTKNLYTFHKNSQWMAQIPTEEITSFPTKASFAPSSPRGCRAALDLPAASCSCAISSSSVRRSGPTRLPGPRDSWRSSHLLRRRWRVSSTSGNPMGEVVLRHQDWRKMISKLGI